MTAFSGPTISAEGPNEDQNVQLMASVVP